MRYLLNAFSPSMLKSETNHVVFAQLSTFWAESVFRGISADESVNALNPRHAALFEALAPWGAHAPSSAEMVQLNAGDDALVILPRAQNRAGTEVQTARPSDFQFFWCGVFDGHESLSVREPVVDIYESFGGDIGTPHFELRALSDLKPLERVHVHYGADWYVSGQAFRFASPKLVYRGMLF